MDVVWLTLLNNTHICYNTNVCAGVCCEHCCCQYRYFGFVRACVCVCVYTSVHAHSERHCVCVCVCVCFVPYYTCHFLICQVVIQAMLACMVTGEVAQMPVYGQMPVRIYRHYLYQDSIVRLKKHLLVLLSSRCSGVVGQWYFTQGGDCQVCHTHVAQELPLCMQYWVVYSVCNTYWW